jgi:TonB family protein
VHKLDVRDSKVYLQLDDVVQKSPKNYTTGIYLGAKTPKNTHKLSIFPSFKPSALSGLKDTTSQNDTDGDKILNDEKLIYSTFFDRVRAQLDARWQSEVKALVLQYYTKQGIKIGQQMTRVFVTLNTNGMLIDIKILNHSTDAKLDALALEAFKQSIMFPNPPKDLIKDGKIVFDWHFLIY